MNIVLLEPEIPQNTGNIGRTCIAAGASLHLIRPLGFFTDERSVKRAGLDYWRDLEVCCYDSFTHFCREHPDARLYLATTKARMLYTEPRYYPGDFFMLGKESAGIPEEILLAHRDNCVRIPMAEGSRSLNLACAAAILLYEALRQNAFENLRLRGELHTRSWNERV
ncbi:MAG: tRNA (cytidine(34)-2'-O)-methyltransferase [Clostridiales bacterium]|jgi:tRNA (cytidine/uridine-2'-O-)-methyltransferase|nr:tRNA (cytidine(34)-2'-O)-methyltransferase [Clostridiales bacterium]